MTEARLHHYVPQFYLRRFADSSGLLWLWDRNQDRAFQTRPGNVAAERDFYRLTELIERGHDPLTMEKQFADLESQVSAITGQWLDWLRIAAPGEAIDIPDINRELVALYIALQFLRTADSRDILAAFAEMGQSGVPLSPADKRRMHTELLWKDDAFRSLAERIEQSIWLFGRNRTSEPFVTSDNPVAFRTGDNRRWLKAGVFSQGTYVVYPLAPDIVMYCHPNEPPWDRLAQMDRCLSPVTFTEEMVESENSGQVFMASRFVISSTDRFHNAREFAPTIGTDTYASRDGSSRSAADAIDPT